jgi:hypothetical protein
MNSHQAIPPWRERTLARFSSLHFCSVRVKKAVAGRPGGNRVDEAQFSDEIKELEAFMHSLRGELEQSLGIPAKVRLVEPATMSEYKGQLGRIIDERTSG